MPDLILNTSNQLEVLARRLSEVTAKPLGSPLRQELVVVQSFAIRRWLIFQIAQERGICANFTFPYISDFVAWLVTLGSQEEAILDKTAPEFLAWDIDALLATSLGEKEFAPLARYLRDGDSLKRFHLASRLAHLF